MPQKSIKTMPLLGESGDDSQVDIHEGTENGEKASPRDQKASQLSFRPVHLQVEKMDSRRDTKAVVIVRTPKIAMVRSCVATIVVLMSICGESVPTEGLMLVRADPQFPQVFQWHTCHSQQDNS